MVFDVYYYYVYTTNIQYHTFSNSIGIWYTAISNKTSMSSSLNLNGLITFISYTTLYTQSHIGWQL